MASVSREPTSTISAPSAGLDPGQQRQISPNPQLSSLANAGLRASASPKALKNNAASQFQAPVLTGAGAMADEQRHKTQQTQNTQQPRAELSANPAVSSVNALMGRQAQPMSRPADGPPASSTPQLPSITTKLPTTEPMQMDGVQQTSPTSMSSTEPFPGRIQQGSNPASNNSNNVFSTPQSESQSENRSNKALTYPPRPTPDQMQSTPGRGMSLPNSSSRSSLLRKHKCPHCDTEFTRQHNLKSHLLTHSHEKPYGCNQCEMKFRRLHDLKRHTKLHTGERPHTCNKCGRSFARGDALARHMKGPGGCAGQRGSGGEEDYSDGGNNGEGMEGVEYEEGDGYASAKRRKSEPNNNRKRSLHRNSNASPTPYRQHSSTFPPGAAAGVAPMGRGNYGHESQTGPSSHLSPRSNAAAPSQLNVPSSLFAQGSMTESPRPLSPGTAESRRLSATLPPPGGHGRSPSNAQSFPYPASGRGTGRGTPPVGLPPPLPQNPQLPSLAGLNTEVRRPSVPSPGSSGRVSSKSSRPPPIMAPSTSAAPGVGSTSTNPGSASSHQRSSAGSLREIMNNGSGSSDDYTREQLRNKDSEIRSLREEMATKTNYYETLIAKMKEEMAALQARTDPQTVQS